MVGVRRTLEIIVTRRTGQIALALTSLFLLTACSGAADPDPAANDPGASEPPGASVDETTQAEPTATSAPDSSLPLSCPGVMASDDAFELSMTGWGLKEQVAVTGGEFQLDPTGASGATTPVDRGLSCSIYGADYEVGVTFSYFETSERFDGLIADLEANGYALVDTETDRADFYRLEESPEVGHGFDQFAVIGSGWAVVGWSALDHDLTPSLFTGQFHDVDPNDYLASDQGTLGCSMFLGEQRSDDPATQVPIAEAHQLSVLRGGDRALTTNRDHESENFDVLCDQIVWHEAESAPESSGDAIATTPECEIFQRGERDFIADCGDAGYAEVAASELTATQVRTPAFRGFDE
jgi:hypothetical protein